MQLSVQVDGEAAESFIAEKRIGERIKHLRLKKSMGLVELGRHTGLSASFLSQLETGRVVPTLRNLARISMVFSKDLSYFFEPEPQTLFRIHKAKDRVSLPQSGVADPAYFFQSLGYMVPDRQLDPYYAEFLPARQGRETRAHQHIGCEFFILLTGRLDIQHGEITHHIEAGDAVLLRRGHDSLLQVLGRGTGDRHHRHAATTPGAQHPPDGTTRRHLLESGSCTYFDRSAFTDRARYCLGKQESRSARPYLANEPRRPDPAPLGIQPSGVLQVLRD